ncbi:MAG TPA: hypothetical protein VMM15_26785 [Bradyrhizobium sp.]|nr:hypothetical protein [Bradyrhizobium sp.]
MLTRRKLPRVYVRRNRHLCAGAATARASTEPMPVDVAAADALHCLANVAGRAAFVAPTLQEGDITTI